MKAFASILQAASVCGSSTQVVIIQIIRGGKDFCARNEGSQSSPRPTDSIGGAEGAAGGVGGATDAEAIAACKVIKSTTRYAPNDPSEPSKRRVSANKTKRKSNCARGHRESARADRVNRSLETTILVA